MIHQIMHNFRVNRNGTCYTTTECTDEGGTASGNCASGFGICCLFTLSSSSSLTVSQNNTYIQNPSFPSVYTDTSALTYTINKCADSKYVLYLLMSKMKMKIYKYQPI